MRWKTWASAACATQRTDPRWAEEIEAAIDNCEAIITVISPNSMASDWVEKEFLYTGNAQKKIVPLTYEMCKLPMWLLNMHYVDIQGKNYEKNFKSILNAIEEEEDEPPSVTPKQAQGPFKLNPVWIGGIAGGILLVLMAFFGLRAFLGNSGPGPEGLATDQPVASFSTFTPVPVIATSFPEPTASEEPAPSDTVTPEPATESPASLTPEPVRVDAKGVEMLLVFDER